MKRVLLQTVFFACFSLLSCLAYGQGTGALYMNNFDGWQSMIRYHKRASNYITYSWALMGSQNHFAITDIMGVIIDANVTEGYFVNDFEVFDGYVFFCGQNASMSGFLGWFDIDKLFYGTGRVHIDETLSLLGIESLDNIEVYLDRLERIHIAGLGQHIVSGLPTTYKAFEAVGDPAVGMQYRVADLSANELNPTLTVTEDYVVYVSRTTNAASSNYGVGVVLEPFPKNDMFAMATHPSFLFQTIALMHCNANMVPDACDPFGIHLKAVAKTKNTIAVCNYRTGSMCTGLNLYQADTVYNLVIREFDLSPQLVSNSIQMMSDSRISLPFGVSDIRELKYDPLTKQYVVLFHHEVLSGTWRDAILTADYSPGYALSPVRVDYQSAFPNWRGWSLCLNGSSRYTVTGWDNTYYNYHFWQDDIPSVSGVCNDINWYVVGSKSPEIDKKNVEMSNVVGWYNLNFVPNREVELYFSNNSLICN